MRRVALTVFVCLGLLLAWAQIAFGETGGGNAFVRPLGVGDVSVPAVIFMVWTSVRKLWAETIEVHRERAKAEASLAAQVRELSAEMRTRRRLDEDV